MKDIVEIAQILTGIAAVVSIFFTIYVYRSQKIDKQHDVAMNISSWNIAMDNDKQDELARELNPEYYNNGTYVENTDAEWHNPANCSNITINNNPFPIYNLIIVFVPNYFKFRKNDSLSTKYQCFYYEVLTPGKKMTDFVNEHAMGGENLLPELYFTDNNNIQWHRSKNGVLKKTAYIDKAVKLGIIQKNL